MTLHSYWHQALMEHKYIILPVIVTILLIMAVMAEGAEEDTDEQIVNAIYLAEGGNRATFAYGIRSIKYTTKSDARQICFNSVRNGRKRWIKAGKPYDLITFIGLRYCPPKAHKLNSNWVKNVKYFLARAK